ncbi:MAG: hypothetical protein IJ714_08845 [Bacteroidales bacterium]|nr:hypothetical protein [Bacteroidales bacterium]
MTNFGYNNRWIRLVKDVVFVLIAVFLVVRGRTLGLILGLLFGYWYGRDAWYQIKAIWQEKTYKAPPRQQQDGPVTQAPADDKITVTDLTDAKEVEYRKED